MSVPLRLYRSLLKVCRRFDASPLPRSIEPLLNSPVVLRHAGFKLFLGEESAMKCVQDCFRNQKNLDDAVVALNDGFHCLRALQDAEDLAQENLVVESDESDYDEFPDDDEDSDSEEEHESELQGSDQPIIHRIAIFPDRPHFVHEPFELEDLLGGNRHRTSDGSKSNSNRVKQRCSQQLTLELISAIESEDALTVQSITSEILEISVNLIPQHLLPAVIESCCSTLNIQLVFELFEKLRQQEIVISARTLSPLLQHAGAYDDVSAAFAALRESRWALNRLAPVAVNCEPDDPFDRASIHAVMWICSNVCQHDIVEKLFKLMIDRGGRPDATTMIILLRSICIRPNPDLPRAVELVSIFEREWNISPNSDAFNVMLFACYNSPAYNLNDAIKLLRSMEKREIQPTKESYQALLLCAAKDERERLPISLQVNSILSSLDKAGFNVDELINDIANKLAARWRL